MTQEPSPVDVGLPIGEAASRLGISVPALRKRIRRGSVHAHKHEGRWYVALPTTGSMATPPDTGRVGQPGGQDALIEQLRSENAFLRGLVAELSRRVPELPAGSNPVPEIVPEQAHSAPQTAATPPPRRSWWRRLISG